MQITARHWLIAVLIAGLTHAALALALVSLTGPATIAPAGITIELGDGGLSAAAGADGDGSPAQGLTPPTLSPAPSVGATTALQEETGQTVDATTPSEQVSPLQPVATVETIAAKDLPKPEPKPVSKRVSKPEPKPVSKPASVVQPSRARREQRPSARESRSNIADTNTKLERPDPAGTASRPAHASSQERIDKGATGGRSAADHGNAKAAAASGRGTGGRHGGGSAGTGSSGDANETSTSNYYGRLATWLARHKRYPAQARRLRQEGTVKVTFTITRSGRVVSKRIIQSSGYALLDQEVQAMLERASPLPRIPSSLDRSSLTITLPVAFALR